MKRSLLALALLSAVVLPIRAEILEQILVKVNGEIVTKTEFEQRQITFLRQNNQAAMDDDEKLKKALVEITPQLIVEAVDEILLIQRGRELGLKLDDAQFEQVLGNIKKENKIESDEAFQQALKSEGMTMADLRRALEKQMIVTQVQQREIFGKISLVEEEERQYYRDHPDEFRTQTAVTLREIVIAVPGGAAGGGRPAGVNVGLEEEAREKAEAARARVAAGEDFAKVAAEISDVKTNGGLVGPVNSADLAPTFQQAIQSLKTGEFSVVFRTPRGYQVVKLEAMTESTVQPFEQVRAQIADKIYGQRRRTEFEKYLKRLRAEAIIEWKNDELKKAFELRAGPPAAAPAPATF